MGIIASPKQLQGAATNCQRSESHSDQHEDRDILAIYAGSEGVNRGETNASGRDACPPLWVVASPARVRRYSLGTRLSRMWFHKLRCSHYEI